MLHQCTRATVAHGVTLGSLIPILNRSIQLFFLVFFSCGIYPRINLPYPTIPSFTTHFWSYWDGLLTLGLPQYFGLLRDLDHPAWSNGGVK